MKVFVAGATGAIGVPLLRRLREGGHEVSAISRSPEKVAKLEAQGVSATVCDALDAAALEAAVVAAAPEVCIGQLTDLPADFSPKAMERAYKGNDRVRAQGTPNLIAAAQKAGARRVVVQSICFWYDPAGSGPAGEDEQFWRGAPPPLDGAMGTLWRQDAQTIEAQGIEGVVLRYGVFYGPGTWYGRGESIAREVARRRFPIVGRGAGVTSYVHIEDAAAATVQALTGPAGVFNICDDEPLDQATWLPLYAAALGAKPPRRVPEWLARMVVGRGVTEYVTRMRGASNARARDVMGWVPEHRSVRTGFQTL